MDVFLRELCTPERKPHGGEEPVMIRTCAASKILMRGWGDGATVTRVGPVVKNESAVGYPRFRGRSRSAEGGVWGESVSQEKGEVVLGECLFSQGVGGGLQRFFLWPVIGCRSGERWQER